MLAMAELSERMTVTLRLIERHEAAHRARAGAHEWKDRPVGYMSGRDSHIRALEARGLIEQEFNCAGRLRSWVMTETGLALLESKPWRIRLAYTTKAKGRRNVWFNIHAPSLHEAHDRVAAATKDFRHATIDAKPA